MFRNKIPAVVFIFLFLTGRVVFSQNIQTLRYTTKEGMPSNSVYRTLIDKKGFLWIGTETGASRYDGRTFKNYFTTNGLPDNEVTEMYVDNGGRVWAIAFRKKPAYYDETKDRFINSDEDPELNKIDLGNTSTANILQHGGIAFSTNNKSVYVYKDGKTTAFASAYSAKFRPRPDVVIDYQPGNYIVVSTDSLRYLESGRMTRAIYFGQLFTWTEFFNNNLYLLYGNSIQRFAFNKSGIITEKIRKEFPFQLRIMCRIGKNLSATSASGTTYLLDAQTLEIKDIIYNAAAVRHVMADNNNNYWLSTKDEGLIKIQQKRISSYTTKQEFVKGFNSILKTGNRIIAGNNKGELYSYDGVYDLKRLDLNVQQGSGDTWTRGIIDLGEKLYVATQTGSFIIDKQRFKIEKSYLGTSNKSPKAVYKLNDSTLLLGAHSTITAYNARTGQYGDSVIKRITAIGADAAQHVYIGSIDGLYHWDKDSLFYYGSKYKELTYRVVSIVNTNDNLMWIARSSDALLVLKDDSLIASIPMGSVVPGTVCKAMYSNKPGAIWVGTDKGLNKISYRFVNGKLEYNNVHFSTADGLIGEEVNDIVIDNDTVYAATSGGISYLPASLSLPLNDIRTFITRVSVNNIDTSILSSYTLPFSQNNIRIEFSAVDLTGFNPFFEYSINGNDWVKAEGNTLSLQNQAPGNYTIRIRSIKRDGTPSSFVTEVAFRIRAPFWRNPVFWTIAALAVFGIVLYLQQMRSRRKQKTALEKLETEKRITELEMQALKAQINPHFVFNCLNSIKGFIYEQDYRQADKYLDKFSELMRSTIDNSDAAIISLKDEIKYLDNYLQLEKLRFSEKFDYSINVENGINQDDFFVPAMLLQPYVENAIRHGMRFLEGRKGAIIISAKKEKEYLVLEIDDNGIGREKATALKSSQHAEYQSKGMTISKRRAELYNIYQEIVDKKDEAGRATGTTVIIKIPTTSQA